MPPETILLNIGMGQSVADAHVQMYLHQGVPGEFLSDMGGPFVSSVYARRVNITKHSYGINS